MDDIFEVIPLDDEEIKKETHKGVHFKDEVETHEPSETKSAPASGSFFGSIWSDYKWFIIGAIVVVIIAIVIYYYYNKKSQTEDPRLLAHHQYPPLGPGHLERMPMREHMVPQAQHIAAPARVPTKKPAAAPPKVVKKTNPPPPSEVQETAVKAPESSTEGAQDDAASTEGYEQISTSNPSVTFSQPIVIGVAIVDEQEEERKTLQMIKDKRKAESVVEEEEEDCPLSNNSV